MGFNWRLNTRLRVSFFICLDVYEIFFNFLELYYFYKKIQQNIHTRVKLNVLVYKALCNNKACI